jgi:lysophospholipase L1-like esterase
MEAATGRRRGARAALVLVSLALALGVTEVALRIYYRRPFRGSKDSWHEFDARLGWRNKPSAAQSPAPPVVARPFEVRLNGWGLRDERELLDDPPKGRLRVAVLGDSFTFGYCVDAKDAFGRRLELRLAPTLEVENWGVCGYGVDQMRLLLDDALAKRPGLILFCVIADDLRRATRAAYTTTGEPKPLYSLGDDGSLVLVQGGPDSPLPKLKEGDKVVRVDTQGSYVLWKVGDAWRRLESAIRGRDVEDDVRWRLGHALIADAAKAAKARGARFVAVLLPTQGGLAKGEPLRPRFTELEAEGIPFLDVTPAFEARMKESPGASLFVPEDGHPNEEGHAMIARALESFLKERKLLD